MRVLSEHGSLARGPVGKTFTDGFEVLHLNGDQDATIVSVHSNNGEGLEFLGATWQDRTASSPPGHSCAAILSRTPRSAPWSRPRAR